MLDKVTKDLNNYGFHFSPGWNSERALRLANNLGVPQRDYRDTRIIRTIKPQSESESKVNTLSSRYGFGSFPLHTDTAYWRIPAKYIILRCINPGAGNRRTILFDTHAWALSDREQSLLINEPWRTIGRFGFLCTVAELRKSRLSYRYDLHCMMPLTRQARSLHTWLTERINISKVLEICWHEQDLLVIDNHRCLHGRTNSDFHDPERELERILVSEDNT